MTVEKISVCVSSKLLTVATDKTNGDLRKKEIFAEKSSARTKGDRKYPVVFAPNDRRKVIFEDKRQVEDALRTR